MEMVWYCTVSICQGSFREESISVNISWKWQSVYFPDTLGSKTSFGQIPEASKLSGSLWRTRSQTTDINQRQESRCLMTSDHFSKDNPSLANQKYENRNKLLMPIFAFFKSNKAISSSFFTLISSSSSMELLYFRKI